MNTGPDTFKHKTDKYSNQNKLFSVHFQGKEEKGTDIDSLQKTISI
jgi:hypothetical protein